ncbi:MAG TPA: hypothetical protein PKJ41_06935 [Bryobacteraceae bacterium]|nr:hypothetical protein [Bryobacteraceae bacterium]
MRASCLFVGCICLAATAAGQRVAHTPPMDAPAVREGHPRLVFRPEGAPGPGRTVADVRRLYQTDSVFRGIFDEALKACDDASHPAMAAACWAVSGEHRHAMAAMRMLDEAPITESGSGSYSNVWSFALAYDWLYSHHANTAEFRHRVAKRIAERLHTELAQLDDTGMALWHGRNQAANGAMIAALALAGFPGQEEDLRRATGHYAGALRALDFSEGWPEGPSYWIYNRALPYALAADCFMTATGAESLAGTGIRGVMRKIGLWTVYSFGPNGIFEPYGDSVGSLRLGETGMWEASADYFARLSRDPGVAAGADFLRLQSPAPYGKRPIHWYAALAYDPSARPKSDYDAQRPELWMRANMPQSMLFGRDSLGVAFMRGKWGENDELFASFKAGDMLAHHDHYDTGHFTIQLGGLLAPLTGLYGGGATYTGAYRLGYTIQTVASNSLLILAPGETSGALLAQPNRPWTALSGGQRVINPTGFDCLNVEDFKRLLKSERHLERATITAHESVPGKLDYYAADITAAYNSTQFAEAGSVAKVSRVTRQFVYLRRERAFVVFDRVETTKPEYTPKFLLHSMSKPRTAGERLVAGTSADDGILETADRVVRLESDRATMTQHILLPERARTLKIGGPHYGSYVEADGDQSDGFDGTNLEPVGGEGKPGPKPGGKWRIEVEPAQAGTSHRFLNVMLPRLAGERKNEPRVELLNSDQDVVAVRIGGSLVVFSRDGEHVRRFELQSGDGLEGWVMDAAPGAEYALAGRKWKASGEGVVAVAWPRGKHAFGK